MHSTLRTRKIVLTAVPLLSSKFRWMRRLWMSSWKRYSRESMIARENQWSCDGAIREIWTALKSIARDALSTLARERGLSASSTPNHYFARLADRKIKSAAEERCLLFSTTFVASFAVRRAIRVSRKLCQPRDSTPYRHQSSARPWFSLC